MLLPLLLLFLSSPLLSFSFRFFACLSPLIGDNHDHCQINGPRDSVSHEDEKERKQERESIACSTYSANLTQSSANSESAIYCNLTNTHAHRAWLLFLLILSAKKSILYTGYTWTSLIVNRHCHCHCHLACFTLFFNVLYSRVYQLTRLLSSLFLFLIVLLLVSCAPCTFAIFFPLYLSVCVCLVSLLANCPARAGMSIYFLYGIRNSNEASKSSKDSLNTFAGDGQNTNGFALSSSPKSSNTFDKKCIQDKQLNHLNNSATWWQGYMKCSSPTPLLPEQLLFRFCFSLFLPRSGNFACILCFPGAFTFYSPVIDTWPLSFSNGFRMHHSLRLFHFALSLPHVYYYYLCLFALSHHLI